MAITEKQKQTLRGMAHPLKPCVTVGGGGVTPALLGELDQQLEHHELIKVKLRVGDREARTAAIESIVQASGAEFVNRIGNIAILYRPRADKPVIKLG